jgi:hypothetical protein
MYQGKARDGYAFLTITVGDFTMRLGNHVIGALRFNITQGWIYYSLTLENYMTFHASRRCLYKWCFKHVVFEPHWMMAFRVNCKGYSCKPFGRHWTLECCHGPHYCLTTTINQCISWDGEPPFPETDEEAEQGLLS